MGTRLEMHVSTQHEAILERIGYTLVDVNEDLTTEALPEPMVVLLDQSPTHHPDETNLLGKLVEALTHPERYRFFERNGELFLEPIQPH
jgi:hypothetical protein